MKIDKHFIYDYIRKSLTDCKLNTLFNSPNLIYDYNEVQELFLDDSNYFVYIVGKTGLNKTDMLKQMIFNLLDNGIEERNLLYLDFTIPFVRNLNFLQTLKYFERKRNNTVYFYLIVNEIELLKNWQEQIQTIRIKFPFVKVLVSCSISPIIHEYFYDNPDKDSKIVVLSNKNDSNTKFEQITFGTYNELKYNIKNGICEIKGLTKEGKILSKHNIPNEINGYPVKVIASGAFHHRKELSEIVLPESIEYIGDYAFTKCENLQRITLPDNMRYIGDCAFLGASSLKEIIGGNTITHIGNSALYGTIWLNDNQNDFIQIGKVLYKYNGTNKSPIIPNTITTIGFYAFANNEFIENVDLKNIAKIEEGAFYNCKNLRNISNYQEDAVDAFQFYNCIKLQYFRYGIKQFGKFAFYNCKYIKEIEFSDSDIADNTFENCLSLFRTKHSIKAAGQCAFFNVPLLKADLRKTEKIGAFCFYNNVLGSINLNAIKTIDDYAFSENKKLTSVAINRTATIGEAIFLNSNNIKIANLSGKYPLSYYFNEASKIETLTINSDCRDNFNRNNPYLKSLTVNANQIGNWAFYHNDNLSNIKLNIRQFGAWCFAYCNSIKEIDIPEQVEYIAMNSFRYCNNLKTIYLLNAKPVLFGANAFYSTDKNKNIFVTNKSAYLKIDLWQEYRDNLQNIENYGKE